MSGPHTVQQRDSTCYPIQESCEDEDGQRTFAVTSSFSTSMLELKLDIVGIAASSVTNAVPFHEDVLQIQPSKSQNVVFWFSEVT